MMLSFLALAAADPAAIAPSNKWLVEYADTMCVLSRSYGAGADKVTLGLRPMPMSTASEIVLVTEGKGAAKLNGHAEIALLPASHPATGTYRRFPMQHGAGRLATMFFEGDALVGLEQASAIDISLDGEAYRLAIPGISGAMKVLSACQDNLLTQWGIDPNERKLEATHVAGNPGRFFGPDEYPRDAIRAGAQGRAVAVAEVEPDGHVGSCRIVATSGNKSLDEATCSIMRAKVRFSPALDKDGRAVVSHYIMPVRWVLPYR